ncbi:hypothetical protein BDB01DRAFT_719787, partial [Pilobolus umbonatus]
IAYWVNQAIDDWGVIGYFMKLVEEKPPLDRKLQWDYIIADFERKDLQSNDLYLTMIFAIQSKLYRLH